MILESWELADRNVLFTICGPWTVVPILFTRTQFGQDVERPLS